MITRLAASFFGYFYSVRERNARGAEETFSPFQPSCVHASSIFTPFRHPGCFSQLRDGDNSN